MSNRNIEHFLGLIRRADAEEIEFTRDSVSREDLGPLAEAYWTLETWHEKVGLVELVQDYIDPRTREVMLDSLQAPPDTKGDQFEVVKAIALCHLDGDFDAFTRYYKDRELLNATVKRYLRETQS